MVHINRTLTLVDHLRLSVSVQVGVQVLERGGGSQRHQQQQGEQRHGEVPGEML